MMIKSFLSLVILRCFILGFSIVEAQECGQGKSEFTGTVDGVEIVSAAEFPWNVAFVNKKTENSFCGGILIGARHALSAAHCFQPKNMSLPLIPLLVEAQLGKFNLSVENETGSETLLVWEIVIHPDWKFDDEKYDADLSIVVLERPVTFSDFIQPICLPTQSDDPVTGTGTVVGWGKSEISGRTSAIVPSELELPAVDPATCYTTFYQLGRYSSTRMFCAGFADLGKAPCLGDSGGGFYQLNKDNSWEIQGIVSGSIIAAEHGCDINKFALFTHVAKFANWIEPKTAKMMTIDWKFVEFDCVEVNKELTKCETTFEGPMTKNLRIRSEFSSHRSKNSPIGVTYLNIDFSPSTHVLSGIGEEFPNLRKLWVGGDSIKFLDRQNFVNLAQIERLLIFRTSIDFLPEDLIADLLNLTAVEIRYCSRLERLSPNFFMYQQILKALDLEGNGLTTLQKGLFKNNLKLEQLNLYGNKLVNIYVDFTRLPAVRQIDFRRNKCIDQWWKPEDKSIQSFQDKINRNCQPTMSV